MTKKKRKPKLPCLLFTPDTLALTRLALIPFEAYVQQRSDEQTNTVFAKEVIRSLKEKLATLAAQSDWAKPVSFDQNEVSILSASLQLHMIELMVSPPSGAQAEGIRACQELLNYFNKLL